MYYRLDNVLQASGTEMHDNQQSVHCTLHPNGKTFSFGRYFDHMFFDSISGARPDLSSPPKYVA
jgi:hypothetical protein